MSTQSEEHLVATVAAELLGNAALPFPVSLERDQAKLKLPCIVVTAKFESEEPDSTLPKHYTLTIELRDIRRDHEPTVLDQIFKQINDALDSPTVAALDFIPPTVTSSFKYYRVESGSAGESTQGDTVLRSRNYAVFARLLSTGQSNSSVSVGGDLSGGDIAAYQTRAGTLVLGGFSGITGTVPRANLPTIPAANIARVDPAGNDTTGAIGDIGKPFLTMQAAISAIEALNTDGLINGQIAVVDVGNNDFTETITTPLHNLAIQGFHGDYDTISGITFSAATGQVNLMFFGLSIGNVTVATTGLVSVKVERGYSPNIIAPNCSIVSVTSKTGTVLGNDIVAKGDVYVSGIVNDVSIQSTEGSVTIQSGSAFSSIFAPAATDIQAAGDVTVTRTRVGDVTCGGTLTLIDSRVVGTNSASSTVYADVLLTKITFPDADPHVAGAGYWVGGVLTKSAG